LAATSAGAALRHLAWATPPSCFCQQVKEGAVGRSTPILVFQALPCRPGDFEGPFPRPFWVQYGSDWSKAFESVSSTVVGGAFYVDNGSLLVQEVGNCILDIKQARQRGEISFGELPNVVDHLRAALLQLYLNFSMRYRVLSEKYTNLTLSANCHNQMLASDDSEIVYSPMKTLFQSLRLPHGMKTISWEQAQLVN